MKAITDILETEGSNATEAIKIDLQPLRATGKTQESVEHKVTSEGTVDVLRITGRDFISTIHTGRGPRRNSTQGDFLDNMLEYMKAKGIGADLSAKKQKQLARFLTYKINKEGDKTYKQGGREVYSNTVQKTIQILNERVRKEGRNFYVKFITTE